MVPGDFPCEEVGAEYGEAGTDPDAPQPYSRYRADGGIFTANKALELKLIDKIGYLPDAVQAAKDAGNLGENFRAVKYEKEELNDSSLAPKQREEREKRLALFQRRTPFRDEF